MHQSLRPYVTAGVAVLGAGMIAITPMAGASVVDVHPMPDVALTAGVDLGDIDFTQAWTDAFNTATSNYDTVTAALQDAQSALSASLAANPDINGQQLFDAVTFLGGDQKGFLNPLSNWTLDGTHSLLYDGLTGQLASTGLFPAPDEPIPTIINFLSSPLSGIIFGQLGPSISPLVSMINSFDAISGDLTGSAPNYTAALQELVNVPANMFNGFLNGDTLNLDSLIPAIVAANIIPLPEGASIDGLSLAFGGLLSPGGVPGAGVDDVTPAGGSIFDALGLNLGIVFDGTPLSIDATADGVGPLGAMAGFEQALAALFSGSLNWAGDTADAGSGAATDGLSSLLDGLGLGDLANLF